MVEAKNREDDRGPTTGLSQAGRVHSLAKGEEYEGDCQQEQNDG